MYIVLLRGQYLTRKCNTNNSYNTKKAEKDFELMTSLSW